MTAIPPPPALGAKFHADGSPAPFAGNTVICHLDPGSDAFRHMVAIQDAFRNASFAAKLAFLPPPSFHMTVFEGVCDTVRNKPGHWPDDLPNDAPCAEVTRRFSDKLAAMPAPAGFRTRPVGLRTFWPNGCAVQLAPLDGDENRKIRDYRDALSETLRLRHADHDGYPFHSTLFYLIDWLSPAEQADFTELSRHGSDRLSSAGFLFELGAPEFCAFDDLGHFERLAFLG
jgi:hypothetical protein